LPATEPGPFWRSRTRFLPRHDEACVADVHLNKRVAVLDADTGTMKRYRGRLRKQAGRQGSREARPERAAAAVPQLVGEPFASANQETQKYLDQFMKAMVDGREAAAASAQDFLANAMASATETVPARTRPRAA